MLYISHLTHLTVRTEEKKKSYSVYSKDNPRTIYDGITVETGLYIKSISVICR